MAAERTITRAELESHNKEGDAWIQINNDVYNISRFAGMHPGGEKNIQNYAGKDATEVFYSLHRHEVIEKYARLKVGVMEDSGYEDINHNGNISDVPFAEPPYWRGWRSPYHNETHEAFREDLRKFFHEEVREEAEECEARGEAPSKEMFKKFGDFGVFAMRVAPGKALHYCPRLPGDLKPEQIDYFHEMICHEEVGRLAVPGYNSGLGDGLVIGLPVVMQFGTDWMRENVAKPCIRGEQRICLAISEPNAGSDVANLITTATKTPDGRHYIVNGTKKWITNGYDSDWFVTCVRTGGSGMGGLTMLLIPRSEGLETKRIKTSYSSSAGTSLVIFEDVKVPVEYILGEEGKGFQTAMFNFNHERWMIIVYIVAASRGILEECFKWVNQREVFGQKLSTQPVIRQKLAAMVADVEAVYSWLESITFQMCKMDYFEQALQLAGPMSLLKYQATRVSQRVNDNAVQIFGGRAITATGMGKMIERFNRSNKFAAILGGSEEIMADLGIRMALKSFPANAKL